MQCGELRVMKYIKLSGEQFAKLWVNKCDILDKKNMALFVLNDLQMCKG